MSGGLIMTFAQWREKQIEGTFKILNNFISTCLQYILLTVPVQSWYMHIIHLNSSPSVSLYSFKGHFWHPNKQGSFAVPVPASLHLFYPIQVWQPQLKTWTLAMFVGVCYSLSYSRGWSKRMTWSQPGKHRKTSSWRKKRWNEGRKEKGRKGKFVWSLISFKFRIQYSV